MWITCQWVITVRVRPSTRVGRHNWTIKSSTVSLAHLVLETSLCSWLGWLKSIRDRKWIFYQVGLLAFDMMCMMNTSQCGQLSRQKVLHAWGAFNTIYGSEPGLQKTDDWRPLLGRKPTPQKITCTKEGWSGTTRRWSACERQSRKKDITNKPPASDSTSYRFWRQQTVLALLSLLSKSPCNGHSETNLTDQEKGVVSLLSGLRKARFLQNTLVN